MNKCCEKYGDKITNMLNKELFKCNKAKRHNVFVHKLADFLFDVTGNVNITARLHHIAHGYEITKVK